MGTYRVRNELPSLRKVGIISFIDYQTVKFSASEEDLLDQIREGGIDHC